MNAEKSKVMGTDENNFKWESPNKFLESVKELKYQEATTAERMCYSHDIFIYLNMDHKREDIQRRF